MFVNYSSKIVEVHCIVCTVFTSFGVHCIVCTIVCTIVFTSVGVHCIVCTIVCTIVFTSVEVHCIVCTIVFTSVGVHCIMVVCTIVFASVAAHCIVSTVVFATALSLNHCVSVIHTCTDRDAVKSLESQVRTQRQSCGEKVRMVSTCDCLLYVHMLFCSDFFPRYKIRTYVAGIYICTVNSR